MDDHRLSYDLMVWATTIPSTVALTALFGVIDAQFGVLGDTIPFEDIFSTSKGYEALGRGVAALACAAIVTYFLALLYHKASHRDIDQRMARLIAEENERARSGGKSSH